MTPKEDEQKFRSIAIQIIKNIIEKYKSNATNLSQNPVSVVTQIINFWRFIPDDLKKPAFKVVTSLWGEGKVLLSTETRKAEKLSNIHIQNEKLSNLRDILEYKDKSIISQSVYIADLHNRGFHLESEKLKDELDDHYPHRGRYICNMITTGDIGLILDELQTIEEKKDKIKRFNWWLKHYPEISILVSPEELSDGKKLIERIITQAKKVTQPFMLFHLTGSTENCSALKIIVKKMKSDKLLNYDKMSHIKQEIGYIKAISIRVDFPDV
ncbi:MAG: hypothetical protein ABH851_00790 [Methanobacteriota archaeon]